MSWKYEAGGPSGAMEGPVAPLFPPRFAPGTMLGWLPLVTMKASQVRYFTAFGPILRERKIAYYVNGKLITFIHLRERQIHILNMLYLWLVSSRPVDVWPSLHFLPYANPGHQAILSNRRSPGAAGGP